MKNITSCTVPCLCSRMAILIVVLVSCLTITTPVTASFVQQQQARHNKLGKSAIVNSMDIRPVSSSSSSIQLNMALEGQSPILRKSVMSATVTAFAMPALTNVVAAVAATFGTQQLWNFHNPWTLAALFAVHYAVTDFFLQQYPDAGENPDDYNPPQFLAFLQGKTKTKDNNVDGN